MAHMFDERKNKDQEITDEKLNKGYKGEIK